MDKQENIISNYNHSINLFERKSLIISGVKKIDSFDSKQFIIETIMGFIIVKGEDLELIKLDTLQGTISIKGLVSGINYVDENKNIEKEDSFFNKLFK